MKLTEDREQSYGAISVRVCGRWQEIAGTRGRPGAVKRFAHYLNDYSGVNLLRQVSGITHDL